MEILGISGLIVIFVGIAVFTIGGLNMSRNNKCGLYGPGCPLEDCCRGETAFV